MPGRVRCRLQAHSRYAVVGGGGSAAIANGGKVSANKLLSMIDKSTIDAVIFIGGYSTDCASFARFILVTQYPDSSVKVTFVTQISQQLQPRFVSGS